VSAARGLLVAAGAEDEAWMRTLARRVVRR
jgi:hypothetical protein